MFKDTTFSNFSFITGAMFTGIMSYFKEVLEIYEGNIHFFVGTVTIILGLFKIWDWIEKKIKK